MVEPKHAEPAAEQTAQQQQAVRRRALPVGLAAAALGLAGVLLATTTHVTAYMPPSLLGVNLAFCAILIGVGIVFYVRRTPGTRLATALSLAAVLLGLAGTMLYTWQAVQSRQARENLELANVRTIARAAGDFARDHQGVYPADLLVLLENGLLDPMTLQSPYGPRHTLLEELPKPRAGGMPPATALAGATRAELLRSIETESDYLYLAGDLKNVPPAVAGALMVAVSTNTVLRINLAVSFADGTSRFLTVDQVPAVITQCNAAREMLELGDLRPPAILQAALDEARAAAKP